MSKSRHIPADEFASLLTDLDTAALAAFIGELWAPTAEDVTVDPPFVFVQKWNEWTQLVAVTDGSELPADTSDIDAVVIAGEKPVDRGELPILKPDDLRQRVLYGLSPSEADAICERFFDMPARSTSYTHDAAPNLPASSTPEKISQSVDKSINSGPIDQFNNLVNRLGRWPESHLAVTLVVALFLLSVGGTALFVTEQAGDDNAEVGSELEMATTTSTPSESVDKKVALDDTPTPTPVVTTNATPSQSVTDDYGDDLNWSEVGSERYATLKPTCNRSYLHVVQIQMNALKYNNPETDAGIRTVRRFASPRTGEAFFDQFSEIIRSKTYSPMLSYDSITYTPARTDETAARVRVVTLKNGTSTGYYEFSLRKQDGERYDGCWMTNSIQPIASDSESTG